MQSRQPWLRCNKSESAASVTMLAESSTGQKDDAPDVMRAELKFDGVLGAACRNEYVERSFLLTQGFSRLPRFW
jgi:hypothetical protein